MGDDGPDKLKNCYASYNEERWLKYPPLPYSNLQSDIKGGSNIDHTMKIIGETKTKYTDPSTIHIASIWAANELAGYMEHYHGTTNKYLRSKEWRALQCPKYLWAPFLEPNDPKGERLMAQLRNLNDMTRGYCVTTISGTVYTHTYNIDNWNYWISKIQAELSKGNIILWAAAKFLETIEH